MNATMRAALRVAYARGWWCAIFVLLPLSMMLPWLWFTVTDPPTIWFDVIPCAGSACPAAAEYAARIRMFAAALLLGLACLGATAIALWITWTAADRCRDRGWFYGVWLFLVAALFLAVPGGEPVYRHFGDRTVERTLGQFHDRRLVELLDLIVLISNLVVIVAAPALAVAAAAIAARCWRRMRDQMATSDLQPRLDAVLYASALVLGSGIVHVTQWYAWPEPLIATASTVPFKDLTAALVSFQGLCYVAVLVAIYVPPMLMIAAARTGATDVAPPPPPWTPTWSTIGRAIGILAPLFAGPLSTLVGAKLFGGG